MKIPRHISLLALAIWHLGCDGASAGAPKEQEEGLSNEVAPYEEKYIQDETKSIVSVTLNALIADCVIKLEHNLIARMVMNLFATRSLGRRRRHTHRRAQSVEAMWSKPKGLLCVLFNR